MISCLLWLTILSSGQTEPPSSPQTPQPPPETAPSEELPSSPTTPQTPNKVQTDQRALPPSSTTSSASTRWLLMQSLQGTWPGDVLDSERLRISGWMDASYTASTDRISNLPMGLNYRANDFLLQQNWVRFERLVSTSDTTEPSLGFRSDWILPGTDYLFTLDRGLFDQQLRANNGLPNLYGIDPIQFYAEAYIPTIARGMDVKIGRFFAIFGVESNEAVNNPLFSYAYSFVYNPFTHTGILTNTQITKDWSVQAGMTVGSDVFIAPEDVPTGTGSIQWAPPQGQNQVVFSFIVGPGRYNQARAFNNPNLFDLVFTHQFNQRLTLTMEQLYGYQTHVPAIGTANWLGIVNYLTYTFTPRLRGTTRLEFFDDFQGQRTGFPGLYTALTAGMTFKLWREAIIWRPELRYDYNADSRPFEGKHGLFTAGADLILRW